MSEAVVNYSQAKPYALLAQGKGRNVIIISKEEPFRRVDGKRVSYLMEHLSLSVDAEHADDEGWACVQSSERTWWSKKELSSLGFNPDAKVPNENYSIFDNITVM